MEGAPRDRTIDRMISSVLAGIDWGSEHVKSACPPRDRWQWIDSWSTWIRKFSKSKDHLKAPEKMEQPHGYHEQRQDQAEEAPFVDSMIMMNQPLECGDQHCYIKMQDPCAPCCCAIECIEPPPCSELNPRTEQKPICECDRREIRPGNKCCDACMAGLERA